MSSEIGGPFDVDILGSGATSLTAALVAKIYGARATLPERASQIGATSAWFGGMVQFKDNPHTRAKGVFAPGGGAPTYLGVARSLGFVRTRRGRWGQPASAGR